MPLFMYTYNGQMNKSKNTTPFSVVLLPHSPGPLKVSQMSALRSGSYVDTDSGRHSLSH